MRKEILLTAKEMQDVDENTIKKTGLPGLVLMERAAFCVADFVKNSIAEKAVSDIWVIAGNGNNGADGVACARILKEHQIPVKVFVIPKEEQQVNTLIKQIDIAKKMDVDFVDDFCPTKDSLIIDAIFGIGLNRLITGKYADYILACNESGAKIISIDIPSGVHATTGQIMGCCIKAYATVTMGFLKKGLYTYPGRAYCGAIKKAVIGINEYSFYETMPKYFTYYDDKRGKIDLGRKKDGNKGTFGKVLLIAGNEQTQGAALLSCKSAFSTGCGMVSLYSCDSLKSTILRENPEVMFFSREDDKSNFNLEKQLKWCDVIAMGPGMGTTEAEMKILEHVLENSNKPLILDADAITLLAEHLDLRNRLIELQDNEATRRVLVMTPHLGELARLINCSINELRENKEEYIKKIAEDFKMILICKDADSFIWCKGMPMYLNTTGTDAMATAGSGDVLLGICASVLAQYMKKDCIPYENMKTDDVLIKCFHAVCMATFIHGKCGDFAARAYGNSMTRAGMLIDELRNVMI